jgi:tripartite-type tricarboxylate transporter receptor subunit TctC
MADQTYQQSLVDAAVIPVSDWTPEKFDQFMTSEVARWTPLVTSIGIRLD